MVFLLTAASAGRSGNSFMKIIRKMRMPTTQAAGSGIISIVPDKPTLDNKALAFITHQGSLYQMRLSTEELPNPDVCDNSDLIKITASPDKIEWDGTTSALARHQYNNRDGNNLFFRASDDLPIPFQMPYVLQIYIKNILGRDKDG